MLANAYAGWKLKNPTDKMLSFKDFIVGIAQELAQNSHLPPRIRQVDFFKKPSQSSDSEPKRARPEKYDFDGDSTDFVEGHDSVPLIHGTGTVRQLRCVAQGCTNRTRARCSCNEALHLCKDCFYRHRLHVSNSANTM